MSNTPEQLTLKPTKLTRNQGIMILTGTAILGIVSAVFISAPPTDYAAQLKLLEETRIVVNQELDKQQCQTEKDFCRQKLTEPDKYNQDTLVRCAQKAKMECSFQLDRK